MNMQQLNERVGAAVLKALPRKRKTAGFEKEIAASVDACLDAVIDLSSSGDLDKTIAEKIEELRQS